MDNLVYERIKNFTSTPFAQNKCFDPSIFTWDDANNILNNPVFLQTVTLVGNNLQQIRLNTENYHWDKGIFDRDQVYFGLINGFTLAVNRIHSYNSEIQRIVANLENIINGPADVHMYISLTTYSNSFGIHNDRPFNLILQIEGECEWNIWDSNDYEHVRANKPAPIINTILTPGDLIYIPPGIVHQCKPRGKRISLSIPVIPNARTIYRRIYDLKNETIEYLR